MQTRTILIAVICGLLTALLLAAPVRLAGLGVMLSPFVVLPLFVSALGFGTIAAVISAAVAAAVLAVPFGLMPALSSFVLTLLPAVWAGNMASLARVNDDNDVDEWFPISTMLYRLAILCAVIAIVMGYLGGFTTSNFGTYFEKTLTEFYANFAAQSAEFKMPSEADIKLIVGRVIGLIPLTLPASLLFMYVLNMALGARIARASGWMHRPKDDIPATAGLPMEAVAIFAISIGLVLLGGTVALIAKVFAGAMGAAFMLVGLAVLHDITRGFSLRTFILTSAYLVTLFMFFPVFLFVILGLAETLIGIRHRFQRPPQT